MPIRFPAILLALCPVLPPPNVFAAETVAGSLERITQHVVTIRRSDGFVIDAQLADTAKWRPEVLAAKFKVADIVEIAYQQTPPVFDQEAHILQRFALEKIKLLRSPSRDEFASAVASRAWREPGNLLQPPSAITAPAPQAARVDGAGPSELEALQRARDTNLKLLANLPNFTADETATRYTAISASTPWELLDVIKSDITIKDRTEIREHIRQNGILVPGGTRDLLSPGYGWRGKIRWNWGGSFSGRLRPVFDPRCPVTFRFERRLTARGVQLIEFDFESPADSCFAAWGGAERYYAPRTGKILVEEATGDLIQLDDATIGFPTSSAWVRVEHETIWDRVKIGDAPHLLPVSASQVVYFSRGHLEAIKIQYANHRHFEANSNITFQ